MQGSHDLGLVALSYLIASLAGFVAIEFASRMRAHPSGRIPWLIGGALAMGTGIWSMHFVGMTAFSLPVPISYDIGITFLSWVAAILVSALALYIVGYGQLKHWTLAVGALVMGAGICVMHYGGMWAMRMDPGIAYRPGLFAASAAIAVAASGAALLIIAYLKEVRSWRDIAMRVGAAMIMGVAVCGMHYTGMAAAEFVDGAFCFSGNQLPAAMLPVPTTVGALLILGFGIAFTLMDARELSLARRAERERDVRVQTLAFVDRETGLPNRARLSQLIVDRIRTRTADGFSLITLRVEGSDGSAPTPGVMTSLLERIQRNLPGAVVARTQPEHLVVMVDGRVDDVTKRSSPLIEQFAREFAADGRYRFTTNSAHCPSDGNNAQWLLLRAAPKSTMAEHFAPPVAPAQERSQRRA
ncbi:MHYT domain-containing protein [Dokdonella sp.]|uniref:MHYT domain-containing protein n=1 Tax=Dokdonella sp. TaxID=2291710 RepID=UPI0026361D8F|nr:MHYT domain-containing protein [Dokdonella sp.]